MHLWHKNRSELSRKKGEVGGVRKERGQSSRNMVRVQELHENVLMKSFTKNN